MLECGISGRRSTIDSGCTRLFVRVPALCGVVDGEGSGLVAELHDRLQNLTVSASSPDKSVTIAAHGSPAKIQVSIARGSLLNHSRESFERQVNAAIRVAMMAYRQGATKAWERAVGIAENDE